MATEEKSLVKPIRLIDNETGESYILEFNRDTVRWAEQRCSSLLEIHNVKERCPVQLRSAREQVLT